jgi:DNA-binding transcriptional LysR family regulator
VAETLSFSHAAAQLGYTQSAISHQIAALERLVETRLVMRSRGRRVARLTPAGDVVLRHAHTIFDALRAVRTDVVSVDSLPPPLKRR